MAVIFSLRILWGILPTCYTTEPVVEKFFKFLVSNRFPPFFFSVEIQSLFEVHAVMSQLWIFGLSQDMRSQMIITLDYLPKFFQLHVQKYCVF